LAYHINAHGPDCQADFGLGFWDGVGHTCGDKVESTWARMNPLGPSTGEMGPGVCHETLNDQWGGLNFCRILFFHDFFFFFFFFFSLPSISYYHI
jgi:Kyakuja-Dileera-Zisupton transposase